MKTKMSWREKLEKPQQPKLVKVPPKMSRFGKGMMLIPTPMLVDELIRRIPKGRLVTVGELRRKLAADFAAREDLRADNHVQLLVSEARGKRRGQRGAPGKRARRGPRPPTALSASMASP